MSVLNVLLGPVIELAKDWRQQKHDEKMKEKEIKDAVHQRQVDAVKTVATYEQAITLKQLDQTSWKDEWFTLLFSVPLVGAFIPSMVPHIMAGFAALDAMPGYYKTFLSAAITAAFGLNVVDKAYKWWQSP